MFKKIGDFFLDKSDSGDEKRFFGVMFMAGSFVGFWIGLPTEKCIALATIGSGMLGLAIVGDLKK